MTGRLSASSEKSSAIGPHTAALVEIILRERPHPEQGFRSCRGIVKLAGSCGRERLEAACERALAIGTRSFSVRQIHPQHSPRSQTARESRGRAGDRPRQHPRPPPTTIEETDAMLTHPTLDQLRALKLDGMADAFHRARAAGRGQRSHPRRMACAAARSGDH